MRMIRPKLDAPQLVIAEEQEQFQSITAALVRHPDFPAYRTRVRQGGPSFGANTIVVAFRPSDEERARLAAGDDIYVSLLTLGRPMPGIIVKIGATETAQIYGVEVEQ